MKSKMFKKLMAASLVAAMAVSMAGCGDKPADGDASSAAPSSSDAAPSTSSSEATPSSSNEEPVDLGSYTIQIDPATGKAYDLGGMEVIIRNWWAPAEPAEPSNEYEEARLEYREWAMETYNFTIKEAPMGDWGSAPQDFVDYVSTGGDDVNYDSLFVMTLQLLLVWHRA